MHPCEPAYEPGGTRRCPAAARRATGTAKAASAEALIFYAPVEDAPWKGALVEVGAALSHGRPVFVVGDPDACSFSFVNHPRVTVCATLSAAIRAALAPRQTEERQP